MSLKNCQSFKSIPQDCESAREVLYDSLFMSRLNSPFNTEKLNSFEEPAYLNPRFQDDQYARISNGSTDPFSVVKHPQLNTFDREPTYDQESTLYTTDLTSSKTDFITSQNGHIFSGFIHENQKPNNSKISTIEIPSSDQIYQDPGWEPPSVQWNFPLFVHSQERKEIFMGSKILKRASDIDEDCMPIVPLINEMSPGNYASVLVHILRDHMHDITLEDFYHRLYDSAFPINGSPYHDGKNSKKTGTGSNLSGLKMCSLITEAFKSSSFQTSSTTPNVGKSSLKSVNLQGFCRTFLAIKILLDSIEEVTEVPSEKTSISRIEIYKTYSKICQRLTEEYNRKNRTCMDSKNIPMSISHFGRAMKIIYPKLNVRRLGRRGQSLYHYTGIKWKDGFFDANKIQKVPLGGSKIEKGVLDTHVKARTESELLEKETSSIETKKQQETDLPRSKSGLNQRELNNATRSPLNLRKEDLSPRNWKVLPGKIPEQSILFKKMMCKSVTALKRFQVNMQPIIQSLRTDIFSAGYHNFLLKTFIQIIGKLTGVHKFEEAFPHVHLIMLLLIFPLIIASDNEVARERKIELRNNLNTFTEQLKREFTFLKPREFRHLENFSYTIKRLIHISDMSSCQVKSSLVAPIKNETFEDFQWSNKSDLSFTQTNIRKERIAKAVFTAIKAFSPSISEENLEVCTPDITDGMRSIVTKFLDFSFLVTKNMSTILECIRVQDSKDGTFDLPSQLLLIMLPLLHQKFLCTPSIIDLPFEIIKYIFHHVFKELQCVSFQNFGKRNQELSKEIFKTLWIYAMIVEEYLRVLSEIMDLAESLS